MNIGLGNLTELKGQVLAGALRSQSTYDNILEAIGLGVAEGLERFCNRKFARLAGDTFVCGADRDFVYLPRVPVEAVSKVEFKEATTWSEQTGFIVSQDEVTGYVNWGFSPGDETMFLRFTYTGGYWFDDTEDETGSQPAGSTALPSALKLAWFLQCAEVFQRRDNLGASLTAIEPGRKQNLAGLELLPEVKRLLAGYVRYALA